LTHFVSRVLVNEEHTSLKKLGNGDLEDFDIESKKQKLISCSTHVMIENKKCGSKEVSPRKFVKIITVKF
jgi:hypothetical protein